LKIADGFSNLLGRELTKGGDIAMEPSQQAVNALKNVVKSSMLRAGKRTYFFDVKEASNSKRYLKITESMFEKEGEKRKYNSFILFPENLVDFQQRLNEIAGDLK
jgi:single-stranded DNA-specific DHH superfamily exonuclease